jgi:hypothetical protein
VEVPDLGLCCGQRASLARRLRGFEDSTSYRSTNLIVNARQSRLAQTEESVGSNPTLGTRNVVEAEAAEAAHCECAVRWCKPTRSPHITPWLE